MTPLQRKIAFFWLVILFDFGICKALFDPYDFQDVLLAVAGGITSIIFLNNVYHLKRKEWGYVLCTFAILFAAWQIQNPALIGEHEWRAPILRAMEVKLGGSLTDAEVQNPLPTQAYQIVVSFSVLASVLLTMGLWFRNKPAIKH